MAFSEPVPHEPGAVEVFQGKPICYSLGNFFFQYHTVRQVPAEVYEAYGLPQHSAAPASAYDIMTDRYFQREQFWQSFVPRFVFEDRRLVECSLHPISLRLRDARFERGVPRLAAGAEAIEILKRLEHQSAPFGTAIDVRAGRGVVRLSAGA